MCIWLYRVNFFGNNKHIKVYSYLITSEFIEMLNRKMRNKWYTVEWIGYCNPILGTYIEDGGKFIHWFDGTETKKYIKENKRSILE